MMSDENGGFWTSHKEEHRRIIQELKGIGGYKKKDADKSFKSLYSDAY